MPTYDELSSDEEQLDILEAPLDESLFVVGPPGSGKTSLAVWRGDALAELYGTATPVITYNRMLRRSLYLVADEHDIDIRASTMQSYVGKDYWHQTRTMVPKVPPHRYEYDWNQMVVRLAKKEPHAEALVVDEGQDLPPGFFIYASRHIAKALTVFADEEQAISGKRSTLEQIKASAGLPHPMILSENHRNTPEIARVAEHFHQGQLPAATVVRSRSGDRPKLVRSGSAESTVGRIINEFRNRSGSIGIVVDQNSTGRSVYKGLVDQLPEHRVDIYTSDDANEDSIDVRVPGVTVLNKDSVKGQEFDTVFVLELERFVPCTNDAEFRAMYMMCTRARDRLFLVYGRERLSAVAEAWLPSGDVLER
ncbi:MAG: hypothetical protein OXH09_13325 [Gammaproteobacteria bacterium]|nr:hypothetical protein [Gammaproteobacteria bacterium]